MHEKFSTAQVQILRSDLLAARLDFFQIAETIKMFLESLGYGISLQMARQVAARWECARDTVEALHRELESSALAM